MYLSHDRVQKSDLTSLEWDFSSTGRIHTQYKGFFHGRSSDSSTTKTDEISDSVYRMKTFKVKLPLFPRIWATGLSLGGENIARLMANLLLNLVAISGGRLTSLI